MAMAAPLYAPALHMLPALTVGHQRIYLCRHGANCTNDKSTEDGLKLLKITEALPRALRARDWITM
jgi:hypothetical protein